MTVAVFLLSRLGVGTPTWVAAAYMVLLGLGLGMVMQVLVLAAQNSVDYRFLGVATSGSTLFRQIGGSIGVSVFGAIFANRLGDELAARLPSGAHVPTAREPRGVHHLPAAVHAPYVEAFAASLQPVFVAATGSRSSASCSRGSCASCRCGTPPARRASARASPRRRGASRTASSSGFSAHVRGDKRTRIYRQRSRVRVSRSRPARHGSSRGCETVPRSPRPRWRMTLPCPRRE